MSKFTPVKTSAESIYMEYACSIDGEYGYVVETSNILGIASKDADGVWLVTIIIDAQEELYKLSNEEQAIEMVRACVTKYQLMVDNDIEIVLREI